jgi:hypothetical protein
LTKDDVINARTLLESATYTTTNEDGSSVTFVSPIYIFGSNNFNIIVDYRNGTLIWDDDNSRILSFQYNSKVDMNAPAPAMSIGNKPMTPCLISIMPYNEIITMRSILTEESFNNLCTKIGATLIPSATKEKIYKKFFVELDQEYQIKQKRKIGYSEQMSKEKAEAINSYDDNDEYKMTVEPHPLY